MLFPVTRDYPGMPARSRVCVFVCAVWTHWTATSGIRELK